MNPLAQQNPHRRFNPLKREWVLVSPHRTQRPWQGQTETKVAETTLTYDPQCYLCPGNLRAGGVRTEKYPSTYVFENDFAALKLDTPRFSSDEDGKGLLVTEGESGTCRVICFSPRHDLTLAKMSVVEIRKVVDVWAEQYIDLGSRDDIGYVQIFENRGAMMGASNPHPHGQIWASRSIPNEVVIELAGQEEYLVKTGRVLLREYLTMEEALRERIVAENSSFVALVPFWAVWPFEVTILPRRKVALLEDFTENERSDFASILQTTTATYDQVFDSPFPYSMGLHPAPCDGQDHPEWQFHVHFYPPLLRSATIRKFMVGYELLGSPQRDITPESAAEVLRQAGSRIPDSSSK
ncbi:MAG TPA: UDP-glucose--hexose-1-phosphate uridylyltransferase [Edaphobacter sp.]|nr:UDP-glucose--hexose-1-phosphate uridylyltransferase [Edaphobacter sp.]